jgi:hypothetical protein
MLKPKMHFEQVPIETVRKIVERQIAREKMTALPVAAGKEEPEEHAEKAITVTR